VRIKRITAKIQDIGKIKHRLLVIMTGIRTDGQRPPQEMTMGRGKAERECPRPVVIAMILGPKEMAMVTERARIERPHPVPMAMKQAA
jgi:hypothetical protein